MLSSPEPGLFQGKALCNWLLFSFLFSMYLPGPQISAPKLLIGNVGKELHLKEKENGAQSCLGPAECPHINQHDCPGCC